MTKLYYKDPVDAAYMAREFGVKLNNRGRGAYPIISLNVESGNTGAGTKEKYYIHPDSYGIFEPQSGDVWQYILLSGYCILTGDESIKWARYIGGKIIQRNGKPFFVPEVEL